METSIQVYYLRVIYLFHTLVFILMVFGMVGLVLLLLKHVLRKYSSQSELNADAFLTSI